MLLTRKHWGQHKPPLGTRLNPSHPQCPDYSFPMQENGGLLTTDAYPTANTAVFNGTVRWAPGRASGSCLWFDGSTGYVSWGSTGTIRYNRNFTLACWFNTTTTTGAHGLLGHGNTGWYFRLSGDKLALLKSQVALLLTGVTAVTTNTWYHGAVTVDPAGAINLYLNGVKDASGSTAATFFSGSPTAVLIGGDGVGGSRNDYWSGMLDHALYYGRALTQAEIWNLYVAPFEMFIPPSPRRQYKAAATAIAFDAASNSGYQAAASTYSWSHTCTGTNRYLAVDVSMLSVPGTTVTGITYNGVAMTLIGAKSTISGAGRVECWGLANPASGSNTIAVTLSASIVSTGTAVSYTGVNQNSPTEAFNSAQATNVGAADATVNVTTVIDNSWVHGAVATDDGSVTANQTSRNNVSGAGGSGADEDTGPVTPAGSTTISYSGVGALATWAIAGYAIRPVAAYDTSFFPYDRTTYLFEEEEVYV